MQHLYFLEAINPYYVAYNDGSAKRFIMVYLPMSLHCWASQPEEFLPRFNISTRILFSPRFNVPTFQPIFCVCRVLFARMCSCVLGSE